MVDQLTQIPNRRSFEQQLDKIWRELCREQYYFSLPSPSSREQQENLPEGKGVAFYYCQDYLQLSMDRFNFFNIYP